MAEMASWFNTEEGVVFLTDDDVYAHQDYHDRRDSEIPWNNLVGHAGILTVFKVPDKYPHTEGFVDMPDVIKKHIFDGKMDMLFAHAGNLREATPEFIYTMKRLANRFPNVESQLGSNPFRKIIGNITLKQQLELCAEHGLTGSTIGAILRQPTCDEDTMLVALQKARYYLDQYGNNQHYFDIIKHRNVTKKVLAYIINNIGINEVNSLATNTLATFKVPKRKMKLAEAEVVEVTSKKFGKHGIVRSLA